MAEKLSIADEFAANFKQFVENEGVDFMTAKKSKKQKAADEMEADIGELAKGLIGPLPHSQKVANAADAFAYVQSMLGNNAATALSLEKILLAKQALMSNNSPIAMEPILGADWPTKFDVSDLSTVSTFTSTFTSPPYKAGTDIVTIGPKLEVLDGDYPGEKVKTSLIFQTTKLPDFERLRTQKARGVWSIKEQYEICDFGDSGNIFKVWASSKIFGILPHGLDAALELPAFARPCPVRPRHGFVESRMVETLFDIWVLFEETKKADPDAELLLMPRLTGLFSGVANNVGMTWGFKNDGVTSGVGALHIPADTPSSATWSNSSRWRFVRAGRHTTHELGFPPGTAEVPYLEFVEDESKSMIVQIRPGPAGDFGALDFIPHPIAVREGYLTKFSNWLEQNTDEDEGEEECPNGELLLEWEYYVSSLDPLRDVISAPGIALSSHWAVHAIARGITFVPRAVELGDFITPERTRTLPVLSPSELGKLASLCRNFNNIPLLPEGPSHMHSPKWADVILAQAGLTALGSVHAQNTWDGSEHLLALRAFGVTALARLLGIICLGEFRHWYTAGPGRGHSGRERCPIDFGAFNIQLENQKPERDTVFCHAAFLSFDELRRLLPTIHTGFNHAAWHGSSKGSAFGGEKWAESTLITMEYISELQRFMDEPNAERWGNVIIGANKVISAAHNGGVLLDKVVESGVFDLVHSELPLFFTNSTAGAVTLYGTEYLNKLRGFYGA